MQLRINLADREEIEAAVPLLQLILDGTMKPTRVAPLVQSAPLTAGAITPSNAPEAATVFSAGNPAPSLPAPPAPGMVAPTASGVAPTANAPAVELDKNGLPWDARIHSSTKSKLKSGEWKEKRGVEAATVAAIEAELRDAYRLASEGADGMLGLHTGGPFPGQTVDNAAAVFGGAQPGATATPTGTNGPVYSGDVAQPAAVFGGAPATPSAPVASADPATFEQLMPRLTPAISSGQLSPLALQNACTSLGLANIVGLQQNPALVPSVWALLKQQAPGLQ